MISPRILLFVIALLGAQAASAGGASHASGKDLPCGSRSFDKQAILSEIGKLEGEQRPHFPEWKTADRLAQLSIVASEEPRAEQCASWQRVVAERKRLLGLFKDATKGKLRDEWRDNRWIKDYLAAEDARARQLFLRVFVDQFHIKNDLDQSEQKALSYLIDYDNEQIIRDNVKWLKRTMSDIGWFDIRRYGPEASQAAWLLVQHADYDPAWQTSVLAALKPRVASGDMQPNYYAYLVDRVAMNRKQPQTYGTQGKCAASGQWEPFALSNPAAVDRLRSEVGLEPMSAYKARFTCRRNP